MADFTTISTIVSSIKTATEIAQLLKQSDLSLEKAETKMKLAELINALADAKIEIAGIQESILAKDTKISELEQKLDIKSKIKYDPPYYVLVNEDKNDGPYCQKCYDNDNKLIRLQGDDNNYWHCMACNNHYRGKYYRDPPMSAETKFNPFDF